MKMKLIKAICLLFLSLLIFVIMLFIIRAFSEKHLDDVSPEIPCDKELLKKADILYVIPKFNNKSIAENKTWCNEILALNKTLALHGVYHVYNEFLYERNEAYLNEGIEIFKECFGFFPERFKPPQIVISKENKELIKNKLNLDITSIFHKAYHCNNTGMVSNKFVNIF